MAVNIEEKVKQIIVDKLGADENEVTPTLTLQMIWVRILWIP
jgi:acyl carrier protein